MEGTYIICSESNCMFNYHGNCENLKVVTDVEDEGLSYTDRDSRFCEEKELLV